MNGARGWLLGVGVMAALFGSAIAMVVGGEDAGGGSSTPASSASGGNAAADVSGLSANGTTLSFPRLSSGQFGIRISTDATGSSTGYADQPVRLLTCSLAECDGDATGAGDESNPRATTTQDAVGGGYDSVAWADSSQSVVKATSSVTSAGGSVFSVVDLYSSGTAKEAGLVHLERTVTVVSKGSDDVGFNSKFLVKFEASVPQDQYRIFAPGIWYDHNVDAKPGWFGQQSRDYTYWRETRSGLPLVTMQDPSTGATLSLAHVGLPPRIDGDDEKRTAWVTSGTIRYGSMGVQKVGGTALGFTYPMQEVDTLPDNPTIRWTRRSNPIAVGYYQKYSLLIGLKDDGDSAVPANFNASLGATWRTYYNIFASGLARVVDTKAVTDAGISLIQGFVAARNGAWGIAGKTQVSHGSIDPYPQYIMGYIGQQIPLGFQLFHYGIVHGDTGIRVNGARILDFWTAHADTTVGASPSILPPKTWWLTSASRFDNGGCPSKPIFLRYVTDGMEGMVSAAAFGHDKGFPHPTWERFASNVGDWLVHSQNTDGSWYRAYDVNGDPYHETAADVAASKATDDQKNDCLKVIASAGMDDVERSKLNTTHAIRFLVQLYEATGNEDYRKAISKAAQFAFDKIYVPNRYVGGTTDTPNVTDREAGVIALHAALALYDCDCDVDAQGNKRDRNVWLTQARRAANFTMTWAYAQTFKLRGAPAPYDSTQTAGMSLISTSQSGADTALSLISFDLYRLYLTDPSDRHLLTMARKLESETKYTTQLKAVGQDYQFDRDGLLGEAVGFWQLQWAEKPDGSWGQWLPWLTNAQLDPLQRMEDLFGTSTIPDDTGSPSTSMQTKNNAARGSKLTGWGS